MGDYIIDTARAVEGALTDLDREGYLNADSREGVRTMAAEHVATSFMYAEAMWARRGPHK